MKTFKVMREVLVREECVMRAETYEEALIKLRLRNNRKISKKLTFTPVAIGLLDDVARTGEFPYSVVGVCELCQKPLGDWPAPPGQRYNYGEHPDSDHADFICFECREALLAKGK